MYKEQEFCHRHFLFELVRTTPGAHMPTYNLMLLDTKNKKQAYIRSRDGGFNRFQDMWALPVRGGSGPPPKLHTI